MLVLTGEIGRKSSHVSLLEIPVEAEPHRVHPRVSLGSGGGDTSWREPLPAYPASPSLCRWPLPSQMSPSLPRWRLLIALPNLSALAAPPLCSGH